MEYLQRVLAQVTIIKVNCPSEDEIGILKDNTILIGMLNPSNNANQINKIIEKKLSLFSRVITLELQELNQWMFYLPNLIWLDMSWLIVLQNLKKLFR